MTLDTLIMLSGAFVAVLPSLGFPNSWDNVLLFLVGVFIIALGIVVRRRRGSTTLTAGGSSAQMMQSQNGDTFTDNNPAVPPHEKT